MNRIHMMVPNKIFVIKNRAVRSPFVADVTDTQLKNIMTKIKFEGINESQYKVEYIDPDIETSRKIQKAKRTIAETLVEEEESVLVEELEPTSTLEKILNGIGDDE